MGSLERMIQIELKDKQPQSKAQKSWKEHINSYKHNLKIKLQKGESIPKIIEFVLTLFFV